MKYSKPVDKLLTYGDARNFIQWPDYLELGFTKYHVQELIKMAVNKELHEAMSDSDEVWAPIHARRTLGQLGAEEAIEPLIDIFWWADEDDWTGEELPEVMGMIGPEAIPHLEEYMKYYENGIFPRNVAARSLKIIGEKYPETRDECVKILNNILTGYKKNPPELNAFIIGYLMDLNSLESIEFIKKAYEIDCVDCSICGDFEDVEIEFGLKKERTTEKKYGIGFKNKDLKELAKLLQQVKPEEKEKKIGRNSPCPCGSGKKYKKCCLK